MPLKKTQTSEPSFYVGIGASAGGLEAIEELLRNLAPDTGMSFIFVSHLSPKHKSLLAAVLSKMTRLKVQEVVHGTKAKADHLYVIPANTSLTISKGILHLKKRDAKERPHLPINRFLESLAEDQDKKAIAIILSGTGSDGAMGSLVVKASGGISFAQSPESAQFESMPEEAIIIDHVDFVLNPKSIALQLQKISKMKSFVKEDHIPETNSKDFTSIIQILKQTSGTDFGLYKPTTIKRRIERRMLLKKIESLKDYSKFLTQNESERIELLNDVLINVTYFFRENESLEHLKKTILPLVLKNKNPAIPLRIWVAGCSTGEEAYSIAIIVSEVLKEQAIPENVQIFATDLSDKCVEKARQGKFLSSIEETVSPQRLNKFFNKTEAGYRISKSVRDLCIFAKHDLGRNPSYSKMDIISCKNLLIYLGQDLQSKVIDNFHYALNKHGYLLLGTSETVGQSSHLFTLQNPKFKIYTPKGISRHALKSPHDHDVAAVDRVPFKVASTKKSTTNTFDLNLEADRAIISRYSPPSVVVNGKMEILLFRGRTEPFLSHKHGDATLNLLRLTKESLALQLKKSFEKVKSKDTPVREESVLLPDGLKMNFEIIPLKFVPGDRCYLVVFEMESDSKASKSVSAKAISQPSAMKNLKEELSSVKDNLQSMIQDFENANQDLQSANEEIVSSNEELQSTNEELETSKEELQSTNEELSTVNQELHERNAELLNLNNDLLNVLNSVQIPIVIVGSDFKIRRYTPSASTIFNIIPTDLGRPLSHITSEIIDIKILEPMVKNVLNSPVILEKEIKSSIGAWFTIRIRPYKTEEQKIEGVVISFHEINESRSLLGIMEDVIKTAPVPMILLDENFKPCFSNPLFLTVIKNPKFVLKDADLHKKIKACHKKGFLPAAFNWKKFRFTLNNVNNLTSPTYFMMSVELI